MINFYLLFNLKSAAGEVYKAINRQTQEHVAIKRMLLEKQQRKDLIITEIQGIFTKKYYHLSYLNKPNYLKNQF